MKKCAVINDISGFGKCSLTASIPVMSAMGIQVNPVVTGVFSNQTGYDSFESVDLTDMLPKITRQWSRLSPHFDGILTGFFLGVKQYEYILDFIKTFRRKDTIFLADPVMGDNGKIYSTYTPEMVECVKQLCLTADIITPNLTELKIISGEDDIISAGKKIMDKGVKSVIVTGVVEDEKIANYVFSDGIRKSTQPILLKVPLKKAVFQVQAIFFPLLCWGKS